MKLKVINSNSQGNCYILENDSEALIIECGVRIDKIKQALNFNLRKVVGCIVTHEHLDHSKSMSELMKAGIDVWASAGTHCAMRTQGHHRAWIAVKNDVFSIGEFKIRAFNVMHDAAEPIGFIINHPDTGNILFLTDSYYSEYTFKGMNHLIIEANYCETIINRKLTEGAAPKFLRDRVLESHMSLQTCMETLKANDLSGVRNIILIHLSDSNSDEARFQKEVQQLTGKQVYVASPGLTINLSKQPF